MSSSTKFLMEVDEITKSLEFTQNKFDKELAISKNNIKNVKSDMKEMKKIVWTQSLLKAHRIRR